VNQHAEDIFVASMCDPHVTSSVGLALMVPRFLFISLAFRVCCFFPFSSPHSPTVRVDAVDSYWMSFLWLTFFGVSWFLQFAAFFSKLYVLGRVVVFPSFGLEDCVVCELSERT
jgi:hypothetical protein